jgi:glycosyltransferase domain-containing protein
LIIVDGSSKPTLGDEVIRLYKNVNYFNLPVSFEKRLLFATRLIKTPYAAIISDDEFLLYSALTAAANILDLDSDVSAVLGSTLGFNLYNNKVISKLHYQSANNLQILAKLPKARLEQRLDFPDNSIFYPLVRTSTLQLGAEFIGDYQYSCPYIAEYQMEAVLCAAGVVKVMPKLMWFRSFQESMVSTKNHDRSKFFYPWSKDPKNSDDLVKLMTSASKYLGLASPSLPSLTGKDFIILFSKGEQETTRRLRRYIEETSIIKRCYLKLPFSFRKIVRCGYYYLFQTTPEGMMPISFVLDELTSLNIEFDKDEVSRVEKLIERNFASEVSD